MADLNDYINIKEVLIKNDLQKNKIKLEVVVAVLTNTKRLSDEKFCALCDLVYYFKKRLDFSVEILIEILHDFLSHGELWKRLENGKLKAISYSDWKKAKNFEYEIALEYYIKDYLYVFAENNDYNI